jgi:ubiquinone/menaquinone biosynthesis C-methylase UbiE
MREYQGLNAAFYDSLSTGVEGDVDFYVGLAAEAAGPVLELGCGTGRITLPVAETGVEVVGLDLSSDMLEIARSKLAVEPAEVAARVRLVQGDMRTMELGQQFALIMIPYRAFLHLLTPEDQQQALRCIYRHLVPGGRLALNIFDPRLDIIAAHSGPLGGAIKRLGDGFVHPATGNRVMAYDTRRYDPERQLLEEYRIFEELDAEGRVVDKVYALLTLRYLYRYEMQYLLERCGFEIVALWGDWQRGPFRYGGEQIWLARRPAHSSGDRS